MAEAALSALPSGQARMSTTGESTAKSGPVYADEIVKGCSHDTGENTEGLFIHKDHLYEATGEL